MTTGALMVVGLLVGLYVGARWARLTRAVRDLRSARMSMKKAVGARRQAVSGFAVAAAIAAALIVLYLVSVATVPEGAYEP